MYQHPGTLTSYEPLSAKLKEITTALQSFYDIRWRLNEREDLRGKVLVLFSASTSDSYCTIHV